MGQRNAGVGCRRQRGGDPGDNFKPNSGRGQGGCLFAAEFPPEDAYATSNRLDATKGESSQSATRNWLFVKIYTDTGITGLGECSGWPRVVERAVQDLAPLLIGEDPGNIERLWQKSFSAIMAHGMTGVVGAGALSGIDMALWDIKGKVLGTPVWNLLGGKIRERIKIYGHASTPAVARSLKDRGIKAIKTGGVANIVEKVDAIRRAVGDDVDLMVDLHGPPWMTAKDAIITGRSLEPYNLLFVDGYLSVPDRPGLGVDIVEHVVARYPSTSNLSVAGSPATGAYATGTLDEQVYFQSRFRRRKAFSPKLGGDK